MADKVDMKISKEDFDYLLGLEQKKVECKVKIADIYLDIQNHTNKIVELERERAEFQTQLLKKKNLPLDKNYTIDPKNLEIISPD